LDLTDKTDLTVRQQMLLGLLDHGTRACLALVALPDRRSLTIMSLLLATFRRYGLPSTFLAVPRFTHEFCETFPLRWL
jgi:putative transposase